MESIKKQLDNVSKKFAKLMKKEKKKPSVASAASNIMESRRSSLSGAGVGASYEGSRKSTRASLTPSEISEGYDDFEMYYSSAPPTSHKKPNLKKMPKYNRKPKKPV